jgi:hypothetical protein
MTTTATIPGQGSIFDHLVDDTPVLNAIRRITPGTEFSINTLREQLDALGYSDKDRPGALRSACKASLCAPVKQVVDGRQVVKKIPSTGASARGAYVTVYRRLSPEEAR